MPIKTLFYRFQPAPLYIVLILSICYFSVQLILSHLTHALTLLMASHHMLCNIFALAGSIVTIKHNELHNKEEHSSLLLTDDNKKHAPNISINSPEFKTHNTFGWARIEILTMLIVCITLASLSFSLLVEALQTLVHIDHQDTMHLPVHVMILGLVGLLLNGFTYFVIGGYTLHQGHFLHISPTDGKVIVEPSNITTDSDSKILAIEDDRKNDENLKKELKSALGKVHYRTRRQGATEVLRDISSTIFVIVCAIIVYFARDKEHTAKFIDPVLSIFSCILVVTLSYPYMKEACLILLQTIPGNIDMHNFESTLTKKFPQIVSYHDLHIWQLSSQTYIATVHIIFQNSTMYEQTIGEVRQHFHNHRIANVTIQPEFYNDNTANSSSVECLMQCTNPDCLDKVCCKDSMTDLTQITVSPSPDNGENICGQTGHIYCHEKKSCDKNKKHDCHANGHVHDKHNQNHPQDHVKHIQEVPIESMNALTTTVSEKVTTASAIDKYIPVYPINDTSPAAEATNDCEKIKITKALEKTENHI